MHSHLLLLRPKGNHSKRERKPPQRFAHVFYSSVMAKEFKRAIAVAEGY
jgi:hypothetical protein